MKTIHTSAITIGFIPFFLLTVFGFRPTLAQDQCAPVGWATQGGGTTGGGAITPVTVSSLAALQTQANSSGAKVIYVSGTMGTGAGTRVTVSSDKTIFGLPGATLNGGFDVKNADNVIIRNMKIKGPGAIDMDGVDCMTIQNSTHVWVDHCDISDGQDGNLDVVNGSNYITITWTKFHYSNASVEHQFSNLIGNSDSKTSDRGFLKVTLMFNYWAAGCVERMPRVRFGQVHVVNNLFDSPDGNHGVRAGIEADILVERNAFIGVDKPIDLYENNFIAVTARNNLFSGTSGNTLGSGTSFAPPYSLTMLPAAQVEAKVRACVGTTLSVPAICPCANPLPIDFAYFNIHSEGETHRLNWKLAHPKEAKKITVEHSFNGKDFYATESMDNTLTSYELPHYLSFNKDLIYVRLNGLDGEGKTYYSEIKSIHSENTDYTIFPNPFSDHVQLVGETNGKLMVQTVEGKIVFEAEFSGPTQILLGHLQTGMYVFQTTDYSTNEAKKWKFIKYTR